MGCCLLVLLLLERYPALLLIWCFTVDCCFLFRQLLLCCFVWLLGYCVLKFVLIDGFLVLNV